MNYSQEDYSLLAPGPVNLHPEVRKALSLPMIHHRTPEFDRIFKKVLTRMKPIFQTKQDVFLLSCTGSGGMEALLVNTLSAGDKVISINTGKFGERWGEMATVFGADVIAVEVPWGEPVSVLEIEELLKKDPKIKAIFCQACETSTGVRNPIEELGKLIHGYPDTLFFVDAITALGAYPIKMDEWHIDGLVAGSQKAFMLPTGMAFVALSEKAWRFVDSATTPRFYFDLRKEKKANSNGETFYSSNVSIIRALDVVLDLIDKQGLEGLFHDIHRRAEFTRLFSQKLGFTLYAKTPSDSVTALLVPPSMDGQKIRLYLEQEHKITIMGGQDQAKGKIIRIGHMGYIQDGELVKLIKCLGMTLHHFDPEAYSLEQVTTVTQESKRYLELNP